MSDNLLVAGGGVGATEPKWPEEAHGVVNRKSVLWDDKTFLLAWTDMETRLVP